MPRILLFAFSIALTSALLGSGFAASDHPSPAPGTNSDALHEPRSEGSGRTGSAPAPTIGDSGSIANSSGGGMVSPSFQVGVPNTSQTAAPLAKPGAHRTVAPRLQPEQSPVNNLKAPGRPRLALADPAAPIMRPRMTPHVSPGRQRLLTELDGVLVAAGPFKFELARPEGLEPPAYRFEACCSIRLSYGRALPTSYDRLEIS
jgi:hypothetical protein